MDVPAGSDVAGIEIVTPEEPTVIETLTVALSEAVKCTKLDP